MRRAGARVRVSDGRMITLHPGDIIGRMWDAALQIDDPSVSEAQALVSLRGRSLYILGLRGELRVGGAPRRDVELTPGLVIGFAPRVEVEVIEVQLPEEALGLVWDGSPLRELRVSEYSFQEAPGLVLVRGYAPAAAGRVWSNAQGWAMRVGDEPPQLLEPGQAVVVAGVEVRVVGLARSGETAATLQPGNVEALRIVARFDTVHVHRSRPPPLVLGGRPARIVSELVAFGGPVPWEMLARQVWTEEADRVVLRQRLDRNLMTLRAQLDQAGIRRDLVSAKGGQYELLLYPDDQAVDET